MNVDASGPQSAGGIDGPSLPSSMDEDPAGTTSLTRMEESRKEDEAVLSGSMDAGGQTGAALSSQPDAPAKTRSADAAGRKSPGAGPGRVKKKVWGGKIFRDALRTKPSRASGKDAAGRAGKAGSGPSGKRVARPAEGGSCAFIPDRSVFAESGAYTTCRF